MKKSLYIICILFALLSMLLCISAFGQEREQLKKAPKFSVRMTSFFPTESQVEKGVLLKTVGPISMNKNGAIYVADWNYAVVYRFDLKGELSASFGKKGQGPGEFQSINSIAAYSQGLAIVDAGNKRIAITDNNGKDLKLFKIFKPYTSIAVSDNGTSIYAAPRSLSAKLIDILDSDGKIRASFGEMLEFKNKNPGLNSVFIQSNSSEDIWIAWKYFPVIRRYSSGGELLGEFAIRDESLSDFVKKNREAGASIQSGNAINLFGIINCFFLTDRHYYVLLYGTDVKPRIVEYGYLGQPEAIYEIEGSTEKEIYVGLVVHESSEDRTFYLLQGYPEARVDIFTPAVANSH